LANVSTPASIFARASASNFTSFAISINLHSG
jgi:hypothetical protein